MGVINTNGYESPSPQELFFTNKSRIMNIKQFYDKPLAHASYAIISEGEMAVIDPGRDPQPYYDYAHAENAEIKIVIETHPHADFVSSHLQIHQEKDATIYVSEEVGADYPHEGFDNGKILRLGKVVLKALNTPGHSPDSITVLATDEESGQQAAFTGDTLFVGDVGRPDLREKAGKLQAKREELAESMYESIHQQLLQLSDDTLVYPAHGAGSLCGKNLSSDTYSTIGRERMSNWALQHMDKEKFVEALLEDQPFIPKYFGYDVALNKAGAASMTESLQQVKLLEGWKSIPLGALVVDVRHEEAFRKGHLPNSINIMLTENSKYETWLGAIVHPEEPFYLLAEDQTQLEQALLRAAKIGYEQQVAGATVATEGMPLHKPQFNPEQLRRNPGEFTILDIRN